MFFVCSFVKGLPIRQLGKPHECGRFGYKVAPNFSSFINKVSTLYQQVVNTFLIGLFGEGYTHPFNFTSERRSKFRHLNC